MVGNAANLLGIVAMAFVQMQPFYFTERSFFVCAKVMAVAVLTPFLLAPGCIERPTTVDNPPARPFVGISLTVAVADANDRELVRQLAGSWAARSGAEVRVLDQTWYGAADIGLIPPAELPHWAEAGQLTPLPLAIKSPTNSYRWDDLFPIYQQQLTTWRDRAYALPIVAEGLVLVYRKDAFDGLEGRPGNPPTTWDELAALGDRQFQGVYLPPVAASSEQLLAEFFSAAAGYDRMAVGRLASGELPGNEFFAFQIDPATGEPRLDRPAFRHVAELFHKMQIHRSPAADPATAFRTGEAKVGIVSLAELGRMGPELANNLGIAPLPGAAITFDAKGQAKPNGQGTINRVPYLGWGGRVGVVSTKCAAPDAAWEFLVDAGLPDRNALDLLANPKWGAGPYRTSQLDARARPRWYAYGLTAPETERLTTALRDNLGLGVQNYRVRLRTPNQAEFAAALDEELRAMLRGNGLTADQVMAKANERWRAIIRELPPDQWKKLAGLSLGIQGQ
jgi:ABC-type glycerol-3-phosphate transport system substrate-binding protein